MITKRTDWLFIAMIAGMIAFILVFF